MTAAQEFRPGDTVSIVEHSWAPHLYPDCACHVPASEGWVIHTISNSGSDRWNVNYLHLRRPGDPSYETAIVHEQYARLTSAGPGSYIDGVSLPYSTAELMRMEFDALVGQIHKALDERGTHEGWSNPATWAMVLAIDNNKHLLEAVRSLRRRDGTINTARLRKLVWRTLRKDEVIEPWMRQPPIDVPGKFRHWAMPCVQRRLALDWDEVSRNYWRVAK